MVAEAQRNGGTCAYIDAEHAMDPIYAKAIGVDIDQQDGFPLVIEGRVAGLFFVQPHRKPVFFDSYNFV